MDNNYERTRTESIALQVTASDGSSFQTQGKQEISEKKYHIKKLNARFWLSKKGQDFMQDLFTIQESICKSSKDIHMFRQLLIHTNNEHMFTMSAIKFGKLNDVTRNTSSKFISHSIKEKLLYKLDTNIYLVNPMVFTPVGATSETIQDAQLQWQELMMQKDLENPEKSGLIKQAEILAEEFNLTIQVSKLMDNDFFLSVLDQHRNGKTLSEKQIEALKKIY